MYFAPDSYLPLGELTIKWYSVFFGLAFLAMALQLKYFVSKEQAPKSDLAGVLFFVLIFGLLGARLAHVFFYDFHYYMQHPFEIPQVWKGGLASHGGAISILVGIWLYSKFFGKIYYWWWFDRMAIAVPLCVALIRMGNFFNGELYGTPTQLPWGVVFPVAGKIIRHPVQLYESGAYLLCALLLYSLYNRNKARPFGYFFGFSLALVNGCRFVIEFFKADSAYYLGLHTSQWFNLLFILVGLVVFSLAVRARLK